VLAVIHARHSTLREGARGGAGEQADNGERDYRTRGRHGEGAPEAGQLMEKAGGEGRKGRRLRSRTNPWRASGLLMLIRRRRCNRAPNSAETAVVACPSSCAIAGRPSGRADFELSSKPAG